MTPATLEPPKPYYNPSTALRQRLDLSVIVTYSNPKNSALVPTMRKTVR